MQQVVETVEFAGKQFLVAAELFCFAKNSLPHLIGLYRLTRVARLPHLELLFEVPLFASRLLFVDLDVAASGRALLVELHEGVAWNAVQRFQLLRHPCLPQRLHLELVLERAAKLNCGSAEHLSLPGCFSAFLRFLLVSLKNPQALLIDSSDCQARPCHVTLHDTAMRLCLFCFSWLFTLLRHLLLVLIDLVVELDDLVGDIVGHSSLLLTFILLRQVCQSSRLVGQRW